MKNAFAMIVLSLFVFYSERSFSSDVEPNAEIFPAASKEIVWNKWETDNFIILSIDYGFGSKLKSKVESIKSDICKEWGIQDKAFPSKCKVVCVPDEKTLSKFFSIDSPKFETKRKSSGDVDDMAIWIDEGRLSFFKRLMMSALVQDKPAYIRRGLPMLATSTDNIADGILSVDKSDFEKAISAKTEEIKPDEIKDFDNQSMVACLFLRREFGVEILSSIMKGTPPESACGFVDKNSLFASMRRYLDNLKGDLKSGKTPDSYLSP